uniref:MSP domain-containing protein n=1 Tax=Caenorhabditis japonica TaxID=281687 RepID=A0A8R1DIC3_CAEJA
MTAVEDKKVKTLVEMTSVKLQCSSPDRELVVFPRWHCFQSKNEYQTPQFVKFFIENREPYKVAYTVKAREKIFRIDTACGILECGERRVLKLFLISADDWPLAINEYTQRRLKLAVESLRIPNDIQPDNLKEATQMSKAIWKRSINEWPLERLYTKINVTLISSNPSAQTAAVPLVPVSPKIGA